MILVSIICPTYNWKKEWLSEAIDSVISQSYEDWELIIINDASTNDIETTILEYIKKDKRIVYIKNEQNMKQAASRNKWIKLAKGKYIAFIDDDDIRSDPQKLEKQVAFLENNPDYGLCGTSTITVDQNKKELYRTKVRVSDKEIRSTILQSNQFACSSMMIKSNIYFDLEFGWLAEDYELWSRIWRTHKMANILDFCVTYRINPQGVSQTRERALKNAARRAFWINRKYYPNFWKALIFRSIDYILPQKLTQKILSLIK